MSVQSGRGEETHPLPADAADLIVVVRDECWGRVVGGSALRSHPPFSGRLTRARSPVASVLLLELLQAHTADLNARLTPPLTIPEQEDC